MFCSKCGAENPDGAKFCSKCGAELSAGPGVSAGPSEGAAAKSGAESSTGLSANVAGLLCYVATWVTGIVFVVLEKKSTTVKFHAWQSIMTFGVLFVVQLIVSVILAAIAWATYSPGLLLFTVVFGTIIWVIIVGLWIALMIIAGTGRKWKVPWAGNWAERRASKMS
jgi:uncharacterized membrane protein